MIKNNWDYHQAVLVNEILFYLKADEGGVFIDGTLGGGGHSLALLEASSKNKVFAIDRDKNALDFCQKKFDAYQDRFQCFKMNFSELSSLRKKIKGDIKGILVDLGTSSHQIDTPMRGFSYSKDGDLDMRMDRDEKTLTAEDIINNFSAEKLSDIFWQFGEERMSRKIAKLIVLKRQKKRITKTLELAEIIKSLLGWKYIKSLARVFQALRIFINNEIENLKQFLHSAYDILSPNGRLAVISFHSLEDREVKLFFRSLEQRNKDNSYDNYAKKLFKNILIAKEEEKKENTRSRSAKLRVIEKYKKK